MTSEADESIDHHAYRVAHIDPPTPSPASGELASLVERLNKGADSASWTEALDLLRLAASQLAAVAAERDALREALKPFAQKMDWPLSDRDAGRQVFCEMTGSGSGASFGLTVDDFRLARSALAGGGNG